MHAVQNFFSGQHSAPPSSRVRRAPRVACPANIRSGQFTRAALSYSRRLRAESFRMLRVALFEPEIPPNTGNVARLCAATRTPLHVVGVTGFRLDDRAVRRAGLDYWPEVELHRHRDLDALYAFLPQTRFLYFSTKATQPYHQHSFNQDDCLVFGPETRGLPEDLLRKNVDRALTIQMLNPKVRSLNLANAVAIVLYEALRQIEERKH